MRVLFSIKVLPDAVMLLVRHWLRPEAFLRGSGKAG
jgi:hypothetical protein